MFALVVWRIRGARDRARDARDSADYVIGSDRRIRHLRESPMLSRARERQPGSGAHTVSLLRRVRDDDDDDNGLRTSSLERRFG